MKPLTNFGKGDTYRPYDWKQFNKNYEEIFKKNKKEKSDDKQNNGNANRDS